MKKLTLIFLLALMVAQAFGQKQQRLTTFLSAQYNKTAYHIPLSNYPWGVGIGLQSFLNNNSKFKPAIELTGDLYFNHEKIPLSDSFVIDYFAYDASRMLNVFIGASFSPSKNMYCSFLAGPSFIPGHSLLGLKPSVGIYFSNNKKWTGKLSYINLIDLGYQRKKAFASFSFSIGHTLF